MLPRPPRWTTAIRRPPSHGPRNRCNYFNDDEQSIAFSDGEDVHFVSTSKFARTPGRVCRGSRRGGVGVGVAGDGTAVTALAFDVVSTAVLYVGFESGEVMVRLSCRVDFMVFCSCLVIPRVRVVFCSIYCPGGLLISHTHGLVVSVLW